MQKISLQTPYRSVLIDITNNVSKVLKESNVKEGICVVYCPHTTAGITINEACDPCVQDDFVGSMNDIVKDLKSFTHFEGNSSAHVKASLVGASESIIISGGKLVLGKWQGIYFCEFDGPRAREFYVKVIGS